MFLFQNQTLPLHQPAARHNSHLFDSTTFSLAFLAQEVNSKFYNKWPSSIRVTSRYKGSCAQVPKIMVIFHIFGRTLLRLNTYTSFPNCRDNLIRKLSAEKWLTAYNCVRTSLWAFHYNLQRNVYHHRTELVLRIFSRLCRTPRCWYIINVLTTIEAKYSANGTRNYTAFNEV